MGRSDGPTSTIGQGMRRLFERTEARLKAELGEAAYAAAWEEGRNMGRERAIAYALEADTAS